MDLGTAHPGYPDLERMSADELRAYARRLEERLADELGLPRRGEDVDVHRAAAGPGFRFYYLTDRHSGLQVRAQAPTDAEARRRGLEVLRRCLLDPERSANAGLHSPHCMCGALRCAASDHNRRFARHQQLGRSDPGPSSGGFRGSRGGSRGSTH